MKASSIWEEKAVKVVQGLPFILRKVVIIISQKLLLFLKANLTLSLWLLASYIFAIQKKTIITCNIFIVPVKMLNLRKKFVFNKLLGLWLALLVHGSLPLSFYPCVLMVGIKKLKRVM